MKTIFNYTLSLFALFLFACAEKEERISLLKEVENLLENYPDSALSILKNIHLEEISNNDQAYYYLLLVEIKNNNKESLLSENSHLDWILEHIDDKNLVSKAMIHKGKIWSELDDLREAVIWYQKAIDLLEEKETNNEILSEAYISLGKIFINQSLYDEAMEIFQKVYSLNNEKASSKYIALSFRNIGWTHFYINNLDSVYHYLQQALVFAKQDRDSLYLTELIYNDLASYYEETGNHEKALQQLQSITNIKDNTYFNLGSVFFNLQQYDSARYYLQLGTESDYIYTQVASYIYLEKLESSLGDHKKAYYYLNVYNELKDSIELKKRMFNIKSIDLKYNTKKMVTKLEQQHKTQNNIILFSSLFFLSIILIIIYLRDKKKKIKYQKQGKELLQKEKELIALNTKKSEHENPSRYEQDQIQLNNYQKQIQKNKVELTLLLNQITLLQCEIFKRTKMFACIQELNQQKENEKSKEILNNKEQERLKQEINNVFGTTINNLRENYPVLTDDDLLFCCLSLLKLPNLTISMCFGTTNTNRIKQRKFRIKEKMNGLGSTFLFDFIFPSQKQTNNVTGKNVNNCL